MGSETCIPRLLKHKTLNACDLVIAMNDNPDLKPEQYRHTLSEDLTPAACGSHPSGGNQQMIRVAIIPTRYRVRQTFFSFGLDCEETFNTIAEAEAYGRDIAEGLAQIFFLASGEYADVPYRSPFNAIGYSNEAAFFASLSEDSGAYAGEDCSGRLLEVRGKIKWRELVDRIFEAAITIEPVRSQPAQSKSSLNSGDLAGVRLDENCE